MTPADGFTPTSGDAFPVLASNTSQIGVSFAGVNAGWTITESTGASVTITRD